MGQQYSCKNLTEYDEVRCQNLVLKMGDILFSFSDEKVQLRKGKKLQVIDYRETDSQSSTLAMTHIFFVPVTSLYFYSID